jgi:hypothetical protein
MEDLGSIAGTLAQASKTCGEGYNTQGMLNVSASLYNSLQVQGVPNEARAALAQEGARNFNGAVQKRGLKFACDFATETMNAVFADRQTSRRRLGERPSGQHRMVSLTRFRVGLCDARIGDLSGSAADKKEWLDVAKELDAFVRIFYPDQTRGWLLEGAGFFDKGAKEFGTGPVCDHTFEENVLPNAREFVATDRAMADKAQ